MRKLCFWLACLMLGVVLRLRADTALVFNEIMYHPQTNEPALEWVEFYNQMAVDLDISNWTIDGDISLKFPSGTVARGRGFLLVAINPGALQALTGLTNVMGPFSNRLSNAGATLELRDNSGRLLDRITYGVEGDWPVAPDGAGVSLAKRDRNTASGLAENWTVSAQVGGTPGAENFPESLANPQPVTLVAIDGAWKCQALPGEPGSAWRDANYDDRGWTSGQALFYHGTNQLGQMRSISTLFNTGLDNAGGALAPGAADPHYWLSLSAYSTPPPPAIAATVVQNHPNWIINDNDSRWIGPISDGSSSVNAGAYHYQTRFSLAGFLPATAQVSFSVAVDNDLTNVLLNGVLMGIAYSGFSGFSQTFSLTNGFVAGTNTLEFRTSNSGSSASPAGLRVRISGQAMAAITNTPVAPGPTTYYFRTRFNFTGNPEAVRLQLRPMVDDGAVFYLNGVEVCRLNLPTGEVTAATFASSNITVVDYSGPYTISAASLVAGTNVLAVEVHQAALGTNDLVFGVELLGTAVAPAPLTLAFNEVGSATNRPFFLELVNYGANAVPLDDLLIYRDSDDDAGFYSLYSQTLAPGGYVVLTESQLGFWPRRDDKLYLYNAARTKVYDGVVAKNTLRGRYPAGTGPWLYPSQPTPGESNVFAFHNEVVINEIMFFPRPIAGLEANPATDTRATWIELFNRGSNTVDLTGWELEGGVAFNFPTGQVLAAGEYLVVAKDAAYLRGLYPTVNLIGDFQQNLGRGGEAIVLRDTQRNPANQVHYYHGGRWPSFTAGGGSSLELRNPWADNNSAEAWAASDEASKSAWNNYTYRATAANVLGPSQWNDFIFNLLADGEGLVDDLSVVQDPDGTRVPFIQNGNFENGTTGWRLLGTHGRSHVEVDPDNPANHVLHLVATGPGEHMHNHIETTLAGGLSVVNGQVYEIAFRAKWLGGNNLLNTRLYFNRVARTTALAVPPRPLLGGTPGRQNSRYAANIGPTFSGLRHERVVPSAGEAVTVSVQAQDPQGVSRCELWWSANGGAWTNVLMATLGDTRYTGTIPGYTAGTLIQFYIRAVDGLGVAATFPAAGTNSGALYVVQDNLAQVSLCHNLRLLLTPANTALLHDSTNVMSNETLPGTVVCDEQTVYYDTGIRLKGSERGRNAATRVSFHLEFQPDQRFRGVHPVMLIDRSGGLRYGRAYGQDEILIKHLVNRAGGIPGIYNDICRVIAPQSAHTGPALLFPRHEDEFLDSAPALGDAGNLYEFELIYYPTTTNVAGYKLPQPDSVTGTDIADLGNDKEIYRYSFILKNHRDGDDYSRLIPFAKAFSQTGTVLDEQTRLVMDVDQWMRAFAMVSLCGVGDSYTFGNNHNLLLYVRPADQKMIVFPWDMDFSFYQSATAALIGGQNLQKIINLPTNLRLFYGHMLDHLNTVYSSSYMTYWAAHYTQFCPGQSFTDIPAYIDTRANFARTTIAGAGGSTPFALTGTNRFNSTTNLVTLTGTAPLGVRTIRVNGQDYPLTWTSMTAWTLQVPLSAATNPLALQGHDFSNNPLTNCVQTATVTYLGLVPPPQGTVLINEILYNATHPQASFVELFNTSSSFNFDLSGWRFNGLDYTFPPGALLAPRGFLILAKDRTQFAAAYGAGFTAFDEFSGALQNDGETLTLLKPPPYGAAPSAEFAVVDKVRYESAAPWPTGANGGGLSLQLIDATQDNSRAANWSDGLGWRFFSYTATSAHRRFMIFPDTAGDIYLDDIMMVPGSVPGVGPNLLVNGDFEGPLTTSEGGPWAFLSTNGLPSTIDAGIQRSGRASLHLIFGGAGGSSAYIYQDTLPTSNATYTLSFWCLPSTNITRLTMRTGSSTFRPEFNVRPVLPTPGAINATAARLPALPPVWINEVQPVNRTGPVDNAGEPEPWLELFNAGTNTADLSGWFLADSFTNLAQWAFPTGTLIPAGQFLVVWADGETNQTAGTNLHTSFRLAGTNGSVALTAPIFNVPQVWDYVNYRVLPDNYSYGSDPDAQPFTRRTFCFVTPGATNNPARPRLDVVINEWLADNVQAVADPANGRFEDGFELYNPTTNLVDLGGYFLTDNLTNPFACEIPPGFTIPPRGFLWVWADNSPGENDLAARPDLHVNFQLNRLGEAIGLFAPDGQAIDTVVFGAQTTDASQGRYPDGTGPVMSLGCVTPRANNVLTVVATNQPPVLGSLSHRSLVLGQSLSFTITATDPDTPAQALTFRLEPGAPAGAAMDPVSGRFTWTPAAAQAPSTNLVTVQVVDDAIPPGEAIGSFVVVVGLPPRFAGRQPLLASNQVQLIFSTLPGLRYQVEYKNRLTIDTWTPLGPAQTAAGPSLTLTDTVNPSPRCYYRVRVME